MTADVLMLPTASIRRDGGTQIRVETDITQAQGYAEDMAAGAVFPPIVVFFDGAEYWLADGFHRLIAAEELGLVEISADVREGDRRAAILFAVGCNAAHGLKRSNRDKRNAALILLKDPEWSAWSDNKIAGLCAVTQPFVSKLRASLITVISDPPASRTYTTKHGTTSTMNTANIGTRPAAPAGAEPAADASPEWHQTDIEDFAPTPQRAPNFTPEQRSQTAHIRYFVGELDHRLTLTPAQAARACIGEIYSDADQVARVVSWLNRFQGELHAEMRRREGSEAAD